MLIVHQLMCAHQLRLCSADQYAYMDLCTSATGGAKVHVGENTSPLELISSTRWGEAARQGHRDPAWKILAGAGFLETCHTSFWVVWSYHEIMVCTCPAEMLEKLQARSSTTRYSICVTQGGSSADEESKALSVPISALNIQ